MVPRDRAPQAGAEQTLQRFVVMMHEWFADHMELLGYGRKTFAYETEADGTTPKINLMNTERLHSDFHGNYGYRWSSVLTSVQAAGFPIWQPGVVTLVFAEIHEQTPGGLLVEDSIFVGGASNSLSGVALMTGDALARMSEGLLTDDRLYGGLVIPGIGPYPFVQDVSFAGFEGRTMSAVSSSIQGAVMHELGHAFGLWHDFRNDANFNGNLMGNGLRGLRGWLYPDRYPTDDVRLSAGSAMLLNYSRFFNAERTFTSDAAPMTSILESGTVYPQDGLCGIAYTAQDSAIGGVQLARAGHVVAHSALEVSQALARIPTWDYEPGVPSDWEVYALNREGIRAVSAARTIVCASGYNRAPRPHITVSKTTLKVNEEVDLDATQSTSWSGGSDALVAAWDVDGDGKFDTEPATSKRHTTAYSKPGIYQVIARVAEAGGAAAISMPIGIRVERDETPVPDTTAPLIVPMVTGRLGNSGWYTSDATVTWSVTDDESTITSSVGCEAASVASDTTGSMFICTATSAGGTASATAAVKRDATPPNAIATVTPPPNTGGWHKEDVTVHFRGTDAVTGSGVAACRPDVILTGEGVGLSASGTCSDVAGNTSAPVAVTASIDRTLPSVSIVTPRDGSYAQGAAVNASYSCADALSGIAQCEGPVASGATLDTSTVGERTFSVTATDRAGNRVTATSTYSVTAPVRRDTTPPVIDAVVSGTTGSNGWYTSDVQLSWSVVDEESPIGASSGCDAATVSADTAGTTFTCDATSAGGASSRSVTVTRDTTPPTIAVSTPASGATYTRGASVVANYSCFDAVAGIATCSGTVANSAQIDSNSVGSFTFSVTATDAAGNTTTTDVTYQVVATAGGSAGTGGDQPGGGGGGGGGAADPWWLFGLALVVFAAEVVRQRRRGLDALRAVPTSRTTNFRPSRERRPRLSFLSTFRLASVQTRPPTAPPP